MNKGQRKKVSLCSVSGGCVWIAVLVYLNKTEFLVNIFIQYKDEIIAITIIIKLMLITIFILPVFLFTFSGDFIGDYVLKKISICLFWLIFCI